MALSSENAGRRPRRLTRPTVPPPFPAAPDAPAAPTPAPPAILFPPPDASEVQSILNEAPAPALRARNLRWGWLTVLLLLLVLGGALAYLLGPATRVPDGCSRSVAGALAAARTRAAGWFGRERSVVTNLPDVGAADAAPSAGSASPLSRPIRQARQVIGAVAAVREGLPPEVTTRAAVDGNATATSPPSAAPAVVAVPPPQTAPSVPSPEPPPEARPDAPAVPTVVEWPDVAVSAVVGSGRRGSAIINGQILVIGEESAEGLQLERIEPQAAVLRYRGATRRFIVRKR